MKTTKQRIKDQAIMGALFVLAMTILVSVDTCSAQAPTVSSMFSSEPCPVYPMINSQKKYEVTGWEKDKSITFAEIVPCEQKNVWHIVQDGKITGVITITGSMYSVYEVKENKMQLVMKTTTY